MNIQPNAGIVGAAGSAKQQARGSDTESNQQQQAAASRSESPGKGSVDDGLAIEKGGATDDRGGDGRQPLGHMNERSNEEETKTDPDSKRSVSLDGSGEQLDLDA